MKIKIIEKIFIGNMHSNTCVRVCVCVLMTWHAINLFQMQQMQEMQEMHFICLKQLNYGEAIEHVASPLLGLHIQ